MSNRRERQRECGSRSFEKPKRKGKRRGQGRKRREERDRGSVRRGGENEGIVKMKRRRTAWTRSGGFDSGKLTEPDSVRLILSIGIESDRDNEGMEGKKKKGELTGTSDQHVEVERERERERRGGGGENEERRIER